MKLYLVGGAVRDHLLGCPSGDYDFAVEAESYEAMRDGLVARGLHVWQERPEFVTVRGQMTLSNLGEFGGVLPEVAGFLPEHTAVDSDFTLCRAETQYSDRRHPDAVTPAGIATDLTRRDFTVNAVAVSEDGEWIDPYDGRRDAERRTLRTVGAAYARISEDPLRMLRAVRFAVKYGLTPDLELQTALALNADLLGTLPHERVREELNKALAADWRATMLYLMVDCPNLGWSLARQHPGLWFKATTEER